MLAGPERAVRAWRALWLAGRGAATRAAQTVRPLAPDVTALLAGTRGALPYDVARRALEACGVKFVREAIVQRPADAVAAAETMGYPVVVKADAPGLVHKTEVGGVRLNLKSPKEVERAATSLITTIEAAGTHIDGFLVQEMVEGVEMILGARTDPLYGPMLVVGAGGIFVELVRDIAVRLLPVTPDDARAMIGELKVAKLLAGFRGRPAADTDALVAAICGLSEFYLDHRTHLSDLEINPLIVLSNGQGVRAVDVRMARAEGT